MSCLGPAANVAVSPQHYPWRCGHWVYDCPELADKANTVRTELWDGFRILCREWEFFSCFLQAEKHCCIFANFFPSVTILKAVCQGLVLILCSPVNSKSFNRYLSRRWSVYASVCQNATFYTEQHQYSCITMPYFWWLWQLRRAPAEIVSTCSGKQASPGDPLRANMQATAWTTAGMDSTKLPCQMTVCICFPCETSALIEIGTHQEVKFLSTTCLLMFPWRQKLRTDNESEFTQAQFWGAEGISSEGHHPPQACPISHHSSYLALDG